MFFFSFVTVFMVFAVPSRSFALSESNYVVHIFLFFPLQKKKNTNIVY